MPTEEEKLWMAAWRSAGPELERIRNEELRNLDDAEGTRQATLLGVSDEYEASPTSGILELQNWMSKWRKLLAAANRCS